eukprot:EG_transcript_14535
MGLLLLLAAVTARAPFSPAEQYAAAGAHTRQLSGAAAAMTHAVPRAVVVGGPARTGAGLLLPGYRPSSDTEQPQPLAEESRRALAAAGPAQLPHPVTPAMVLCDAAWDAVLAVALVGIFALFPSWWRVPRTGMQALAMATSAGTYNSADVTGDGEVDSELQLDPAAEAERPGWRRALRKLQFWRSVSRAELVKLGAFVLLSYGCVSNFFMAICFSLSWYVHCKQYPGLFPLAPGQRAKFLLIYAGFYSINNLLRPLRVSLSIALAPAFERAVKFLERVTGLGRRGASALLVVLVNVIGTTSLLVFGASMATLLAGMSP